MASDFDTEISIITKKYLNAGYPTGFIKSVISYFKNQLYLISCLKNVVKFYLNYLIALEMDIMLKGLLIEWKALWRQNNAYSFVVN